MASEKAVSEPTTAPPERSRLFDRVVSRAARLLARGVYRSVDVDNPEPGWGEHPVVLVANHPTGLSDPALLMALLGRSPRFLAKSTLWKVPGFGWLLDRIGAIPVHRAQDGSTSGNVGMFRAATAALADGATVALFPEGRATDKPHLVPLRTGAARIVLGADTAGVAGIRVVPVGIHYEDKAAVRKRAYVRVGDVLDVDTELPNIAGTDPISADDHLLVRRLTEEIEDRLSHIAPGFADDDEAATLTFAAAVALRDTDERQVPYSAQQKLAGAIGRSPEAIQAGIVSAASAYRTALDGDGVTDEDIVAAASKPDRSWRFFASVVVLVMLAPFALAGIVLNLIPYLLMKTTLRLRQDVMGPATIRLVAAVAAFGLTWLGWALLAGWVGNWRLGLIVFVAGPLYGAVAVVVLDRVVGWWQARTGRHRALSLGERRSQLMQMRRALVVDVERAVGQ